jgi:ABC-type branched-subunit amino acid transport system substrate-binding protein
VPDDVLKIGLLLPITGSWKAGRTIPGAAALAVQAINADPSLLGGMRVEYVYVDAGFTAAAGTEAAFKLLAMKGIDGVFGPGAPTV